MKERMLVLFFGAIGLLLAAGSILYLIYLLDLGEFFSDLTSLIGFIISCSLAIVGLHLFIVSISSSRT
ncbi:MAG: hypothetical protein N3F64_03705 [Nitrososphaeria archaeon]|nr:hypothetical protein [Nitrososphaeria archaeon]